VGIGTLEEHMGAWKVSKLAMGLTLISLPLCLYILSFYMNQVHGPYAIITLLSVDLAVECAT